MSLRTTQNGETRDEIGHDWVDFESSSKSRSWMVTYADIMTIIVTFFVLLLSISTIAEDKFDLLVESLTDRAEGNLQQVKRNIDRVIEKQALGGQINTHLDEDGLKVEFANALLFESGEATLHEDSREILEPMSKHLVETLEPHYGITIEGYTDDVPI
ncbi:MAG: OmpA/MotB family protein, partial [Persicimonas sp.]